MHKEVDRVEKNDAVLEPPDADHLYSAKVGISELRSKVVAFEYFLL